MSRHVPLLQWTQYCRIWLNDDVGHFVIWETVYAGFVDEYIHKAAWLFASNLRRTLNAVFLRGEDAADG